MEADSGYWSIGQEGNCWMEKQNLPEGWTLNSTDHTTVPAVEGSGKVGNTEATPALNPLAAALSSPRGRDSQASSLASIHLHQLEGAPGVEKVTDEAGIIIDNSEAAIVDDPSSRTISCLSRGPPLSSTASSLFSQFVSISPAIPSMISKVRGYALVLQVAGAGQEGRHRYQQLSQRVGHPPSQ